MIYLDLAGTEIPANLRDESTFQSKHTGAELRSIEVDIVAEDQKTHERILEAVKKGNISSTDGKGSVLRKWKVKNSSYSYSDALAPRYCHSVQLEEIEDLEVSSLTLGGLSMRPYLYEERFDGEALVIKARILLSENQSDELKKLMKAVGSYFSVVRHGINESPREMRFGRPLWSRHENGIKFELILVEKSYDEAAGPHDLGWFEPEMSHMQDMIAQQGEIIEELLSTLTDKDLVSVKEISDIREKAVQHSWERRNELFRVDDIDAFA